MPNKKLNNKKDNKKVSYPVLLDVPCKITKKVKDGKVYYNTLITIDDMTINVRPVFLTFTQVQRLNHSIRRLTGEEKRNVK